MATIRTGNVPTLVVVDVQNGVVASAWDRDRIVGNVAHAIARAREAAVPIVWVQHSSDELVPGTQPWAWAPELGPQRENESVVHKHFNSAFEETDLEATLSRLGATHLVLAGAATNWCIRATAYGALDRGYDLTLLEDAHTTEHMDLDGGRRIDAKDIVDDLNIAMRWLSYPGRANATAKAAEVDFSRVGGKG
jgi:nicotinamidase-related amidase